MAPAVETIVVNQPVTQNGVVIAIEKLEIAKSETRLFVHVQNGNPSQVTVYASEFKAPQGTTQFDAKTVFDSGNLDLPSELLPGVQANGVVFLGPVDLGGPLLAIFLAGVNTSHFNLTFQPFHWSVKLN